MAQDINQNRNYSFDESQRLTSWLIWTITLGILFFFVSILLYQMLTGNKFGDKPAPNELLIVVILVICIPSVLLIRYTKLTLRIDKDTIYYGWNIPTKELHKIKFADITSCDIITYGFVGYGYKLTTKYGTVYNTSGDKGLQIITKSGEKILIGTHKTTELADTLVKLGVCHNL
jgi:hypothetical protein